MELPDTTFTLLGVLCAVQIELSGTLTCDLDLNLTSVDFYLHAYISLIISLIALEI